ncbi:hypothetical protein MY8738_000617 [Beauveria namnaoensis]
MSIGVDSRSEEKPRLDNISKQHPGSWPATAPPTLLMMVRDELHR